MNFLKSFNQEQGRIISQNANLYPVDTTYTPAIVDKPPSYSLFLAESSQIGSNVLPPPYDEKLNNPNNVKTNKKNRSNTTNQTTSEQLRSDEFMFPILPQPFQQTHSNENQ